MDYGHALEFGAFITPTSRVPHQALERSLLAEQLGLELGTYQDHPYQPSLLDTWTLMAYVAARTGLESQFGPRRLLLAFPTPTLDRLRAVKERVDPGKRLPRQRRLSTLDER